MSFLVQFGEGNSGNAYQLRLIPTDENTLAVEKELVYFHDRLTYPRAYEVVLGGAGREAVLGTSPNMIAQYVRADMDSYRLYHLHDTSNTAPVRGPCDVNDNRFLRPDAANLAAFLYQLQRAHPDHFRNIEETFRQIAPFFDSFTLAPSAINPEKIRLEWREKGSDTYFNGISLSDGSLRFICLATLLLQPTLPADNHTARSGRTHRKSNRRVFWQSSTFRSVFFATRI